MAAVGISPSPVRLRVNAISTSDLTLSGAQTVDSVALTAGMLCAALGQSDNRNAVYIVQDDAWLPVTPGFGTGLEVYAIDGSANVNAVYGCDTTGAIIWGTTSTTFTLKSSPSSVPVNASTVTISGSPSAPASGKVGLGTENSFSAQFLDIVDPNGAVITLGTVGGSTTGQVRKAFASFSLADNATKDFTLGYGGSAVIATSGGTVFAAIGFSAAAVTTTGGQTYTDFSTTLTTSSKLNVNASGGALRFENKTGGTLLVVVDFTLYVSA